MNREEAINDVMNGLTYLILNHARCCASEQYVPTNTPDESDDYIREHKEWVANLRKIRLTFEDLVTGIIE